SERGYRGAALLVRQQYQGHLTAVDGPEQLADVAAPGAASACGRVAVPLRDSGKLGHEVIYVVLCPGGREVNRAGRHYLTSNVTEGVELVGGGVPDVHALVASNIPSDKVADHLGSGCIETDDVDHPTIIGIGDGKSRRGHSDHNQLRVYACLLPVGPKRLARVDRAG